MKEDVRKALNVPKDVRIAQHLYNLFRDYEQTMQISLKDGTWRHDHQIQGIDIFHVSDAEFIRRIKKGIHEQTNA